MYIEYRLHSNISSDSHNNENVDRRSAVYISVNVYSNYEKSKKFKKNNNLINLIQKNRIA